MEILSKATNSIGTTPNSIVDQPVQTVISHTYEAVDPYLERSVCLTEDADTILFLLRKGEKTHDLAEIIKRVKRLVLLCDGGTGKSTELRRVATHYSDERSEFHAELISLNNYLGQPLAELLCPQWRKVPEGKLLILLDGFDEIESKNRADAVRQIEAFAAAHPDAHLVISCRTNFYNKKTDNFSGTLKGFDSYTLLSPEWQVIERYIESRLGKRKLAFDAAIKANNLYALLEIPFYLVRLVELFIEKGSLPQTKAGIFEELIQLSLDRDIEHFRTTTLDLVNKRELILKALERLALGMETLGRNYISADEFERLITDSPLRDTVKQCSLFVLKDRKQLQWQFEHNNFQEYLAARALARDALPIIKGFLAFKPGYTKVIPSWVNTLAFLFSILRESVQKYDELMNWIMEIEPELVVSFEPDKERIDSATRTALFKSIFNHYKECRTLINRERFSFSELARFGSTKEVIEFLLDEAKNAEHLTSLSNAIKLLGHVEKFFGLKKRVTDFLVSVAIAPSGDQYVCNYALIALAENKLYSPEVIDQLVSQLRTSDDDWVRFGLYYLLYTSNQLDEHIDVFLEGIPHTDGVNRLGDEHVYLSYGLKGARTPQAIKQILSFFIANPGAMHKTFLEDDLPIIFENAAHAYAQDDSLFELALALFMTCARKLMEKEANAIRAFFMLTNTTLRAFQQTFDCRSSNEDSLRVLATLADESCLKFFVQKYVEGVITDEEAWGFQGQLGWANGNMYLLFNQLINEKSGDRFLLPPARDFNAEHKLRRLTDFNLLFDKSGFLKEVQRIFDSEGKQELTGDDIFKIYRRSGGNDHGYSNLAVQTLRQFTEHRGGKIAHETVSKILDERWEEFSISRVYSYMHNDKGLTLAPLQRAFVERWCYATLPSVNFKTAITFNTENRFCVDNHALYLWFFLQHLDLDYPKETLLDMLYFDGFEGHPLQGTGYLEGRLPAAELSERILEDLEEGIDNPYALKNHLKYGKRHGLEEVLPFAEREVARASGSGMVRQVALEAICEFPHAQSRLERLLHATCDNFKWRIIEELVKRSSEVCRVFLLGVLNSSGDDEERLRAAVLLTSMQDMAGLSYYVDHIIKSKHYTVGHESSPISKLRIPAAIEHLMRLLEASYEPTFVQGEFLRLDSAVLGALNKIALISDQAYTDVRHSIEDFIAEHNDLRDQTAHLHLYLESLERLYYNNKSENITLVEAIAKLGDLEHGLIPRSLRLRGRQDEGIASVDRNSILDSLWVLECGLDECGQGTAFTLCGVGVITCSHVLCPHTIAFRAGNPSRKYGIEVTAKNSDVDLAIIRINGPADTGLPQGDASYLEPMNNITVAGFPNYRLGDSGVVNPGLVIGTRTVSAIRRALINAPIVAGNSGGPVLNSQNRVVGVAVTGADRIENAHDTEHHGVIPIDTLNHLHIKQ